MPRSIWSGRDEHDRLLDALGLVLEDENKKLRAKYPDIFAKVDAIKADPNWTVNTRNMPLRGKEKPGYLLGREEKRAKRAS